MPAINLEVMVMLKASIDFLKIAGWCGLQGRNFEILSASVFIKQYPLNVFHKLDIKHYKSVCNMRLYHLKQGTVP